MGARACVRAHTESEDSPLGGNHHEPFGATNAFNFSVGLVGNTEQLVLFTYTRVVNGRSIHGLAQEYLHHVVENWNQLQGNSWNVELG